MTATTAPSAARSHRDVPLHRAEGLTLLGAVSGTAYQSAPSLVRRQDGQTLSLTPLLYAVLEAVDGTRTPAEVAGVVAERTGRPVSEDNVWTLVQEQLRPLGLLRLADGSEPELRRPDPLLGLRLRRTVTDPKVTRRVTAPFAALFAPVVVAAVTVAFLITSGWVLFEKGLAAATSEAFDRPGLLLLVFVVTVVSAGFHEFGHAAACRYGGATPGAMGFGLYLLWPAFYTDVTDSYRLPRADRVRVDLGGLYFNAVVAVVMFGVWGVTHFDALLLIIATQVLQMIRQLTPLVRFDGYHVLADLTGVPDLYQHIGPTLRSLLPGRWRRPHPQSLKRWARVVVTTWVLAVVPLLLVTFALMVLAFPRVAATAWEGLGRQWALLQDRIGEGDATGITLRILAILALALPVAATAYLVVRVVRRAAVGTWRATEGHPGRRAVAGVVAVALLVGLGFAWWPRPDNYRPIHPSERGTLLDAVGLSRPAGLQEGQLVTTSTLWAGARKPPTKEDRRLAIVLVPRDPDEPAWVFPFDRPDLPGPGDNQAIAVNTEDGSTVYDVAFAFVWADDGAALNRNEAYALASCRRCTTVAVAFQVVMVVGQADVVVPQNLSAAVNYRCLACITRALAQQLVITIPENLSPAAQAELQRLWLRIERFGTRLSRVRHLSLTEIRERLTRFERQIVRVLRRHGAMPQVGGATATAEATTGTPMPASTAPTTPAPASSSSAPLESTPPPAATSGPASTAGSPTPSASESPSGTATATSPSGTATTP